MLGTKMSRETAGASPQSREEASPSEPQFMRGRASGAGQGDYRLQRTGFGRLRHERREEA